MKSGSQKSRRKGEVHASLIFIALATAALMPTILLMVNTKASQESELMLAQAEGVVDGSAAEIALAIGIYDNPKTAAYCVAGAILGAFLSLTIFPGKAETNAGVIRQLAAKFGSSMAVAVAFGPVAMDYFGVTRLNSMLAISAALSLCGVTALHQVGPTAVIWIVEKIKVIFGIRDNENK